ncbi:MAG: acetate--CoA ligase family protein [Candidatus Nanoarchaeia archaeon]|nr:acetate--CoA ligase family protein [Candidatus Nanoarchaeia archaeon]
MMKILMEKEAEDFLEKNKIPVAERKIVSSREEALEFIRKIKFPVVLKITGRLHKTELKGISVDVNHHNFDNEFERIQKISKRVLVQKYVPGKQLIIGLIKDPSFGHVIMFGFGGIFVEVFRDISFRVCPIAKKDAREMIKEIKAYKILKGVRGETPINFNQLEEVLVKISEFPKRYGEIKELDINPIMANEKEVKVVDARIIFE